LILFRYLAKEVMVALSAVSVTLLVIVMSSRFVRYLAQAASGDMSPGVVFSVMFYRIPGFLELVLPLSLFIAILLAYGRLYVDSEMTVMSACGLSTRRLAVYTLFPAVLVAIAVAYCSLYVTPYGMAKEYKLLQDAKNSSGLDALVPGRFRVDKKTGRVTYIKGFDDTGDVLQQVFFAEPTKARDGSQHLAVIFADTGRVVMSDAVSSRYLVLDDGYQYSGQPGERAFRIVEFDSYGQLIHEPDNPINNNKKAYSRTTEELLGSDKLEDRATLQWRISLALLVPIIALIAQALSKTNHRRGRYVKMLPAFLIYIIYLVALNAARRGIETGQLPLYLGLWVVHGVFLILALGLLFGGSWWHRIRRLSTTAPVPLDAGEGRDA